MLAEDTTRGHPLHTANAESQQCRICLESSGHDFIAPCRCKGSSKWIHRSCLDRWRSSHINPTSFTHCSECAFPYHFVARNVDEGEYEFQLRRRRVIGQILGNFLLGFLAIQLWLCLLALAIRAIDSREELVKIFNFHDFGPADQHGTFLDSLRYHKTTYYLSAVLVSFCLVGFVGLCGMCAMLCQNSPTVRSPTIMPTGNSVHNYYIYSNCQCCGDCVDCCGTCLQETRTCDGGSACRSDSCDGECCRGNNSGDAGSAIAVCLVVIFVALVIAGIFFALVALVAALQNSVQKVIRLREIQSLTQEYIVSDLSSYDLSSTIVAPEQMDIEGGLQPSAPTFRDVAPVTDMDTQLRLTRDMQAIYGMTR
jgi:hypothetical protein